MTITRRSLLQGIAATAGLRAAATGIASTPSVAAIAAAVAAAAPVASVRAADWPERPVAIVVPFPPGGSNDVLGRLFAQHLTERLGQPFVVENRPGANGNIGATLVARAKPDGYQLLLSGNGQNAMNHGLFRQMPYDSRRDFTHVIQLASVPNALAVGSDHPAKSFAQFLEMARKGPQSTFASPGNGSSGHLAMAMLMVTAGIALTHIPYKGATPAVTDVVGGQVPIIMVNVDVIKPHVDSGRLRVLAVTGAERSPLYPDAPTVAESGFPGFSATGWLGLSGPAGMEPGIVARLHDTLARILEEPAVRERAKAGGYELVGGSAERYRAFIASEIDKWTRVAKETGATLD